MMLTSCPDRPVRGRGFTLVEILIVVVVLGILAALVMPTFSRASEDARRSAFADNIRHFQKGLTLYLNEHGSYPPATPAGQCPPALRPYIDASRYEQATPVGGVWHMLNNELGVIAAVGVQFAAGTGDRGDAFMAEVDALIDDGAVTTGWFRKFGDGQYYLVVAE